MRCGNEVPVGDPLSATGSSWWRLSTQDPIAVYTAIRFYHPGVHVLSWLYFEMLFWILPISVLGMACFFPVFVVAGAIVGVFRRFLLWLRDVRQTSHHASRFQSSTATAQHS